MVSIYIYIKCSSTWKGAGVVCHIIAGKADKDVRSSGTRINIKIVCNMLP